MNKTSKLKAGTVVSTEAIFRIARQQSLSVNYTYDIDEEPTEFDICPEALDQDEYYIVSVDDEDVVICFDYGYTSKLYLETGRVS